MFVNSAIYKANLPHRAVAVYMYLSGRADKNNSCFPAIKTIARELSISPSTVKRALKDLETTGYIDRIARHREKGGNTSNLYILKIPP